jgi:hypothetical protein
MNRILHTLVPLLTAFLLMAVVTACVEPLVPDGPENPVGTRTLNVRIALPADGSLVTKATTDDGKIVGPEAERWVYQVQIWAFEHVTAGAAAGDNQKARVYYSGSPGVPGNTEFGVSMPLPDDIMDTVGPDSPLALDFYVLVNGTTVGMSDQDSSKTRKQLREKVFANADGSGFGSGEYLVTAVPNGNERKGLPMSGFFNGADGGGLDIAYLHYGFTESQLHKIDEEAKKAEPSNFNKSTLKGAPFNMTEAQWIYINTVRNITTWAALRDALCPVLDVNRAVSKIRFVFSKAASMSEATEITRITLIDKTTSGETPMLPASTYLFPREAGTWTLPTGVGYEALTLTGDTSDAPYLSNADIQTIDDTPLRLRKDSEIEATFGTGPKAPKDMTLSEYATFLDTEIEAGHATQRLLYLRESDKTGIIARIEYKIGTGASAVSGTADIPLDTDFHRNRWWTIYTYFMSYGLEFQVTVNPWNGTESSGQLEEPED